MAFSLRLVCDRVLLLAMSSIDSAAVSVEGALKPFDASIDSINVRSVWKTAQRQSKDIAEEFFAWTLNLVEHFPSQD